MSQGYSKLKDKVRRGEMTLFELQRVISEAEKQSKKNKEFVPREYSFSEKKWIKSKKVV